MCEMDFFAAWSMANTSLAGYICFVIFLFFQKQCNSPENFPISKKTNFTVTTHLFPTPPKKTEFQAFFFFEAQTQETHQGQKKGGNCTKMRQCWLILRGRAGAPRTQKQMCVVCCEIPAYSETAPDEKEKKYFLHSPVRTIPRNWGVCVCVWAGTRRIFFLMGSRAYT